MSYTLTAGVGVLNDAHPEDGQRGTVGGAAAEAVLRLGAVP